MATAKENELHVAHWNVRTLRDKRKKRPGHDFRDGKLQRLEELMTKNSIDILGISETHIFKSPSSNDVWTPLLKGKSDYCLYLSNTDPVKPPPNESKMDKLIRRQANHRPGVGILVRNELKHNIREIKSPDPSRIIALFLSGAMSKHVLVIEAYAPTEPSKSSRDETVREALKNGKEAVKDKFYRDLESVIKTGKHMSATIVLLGDFNARTGSDDKWKDVIGPYSFIVDPGRITKLPSSPSDNGFRLIELCLKNDLRIINNLFPRENTNKWTWRSPRGATNRIDFIIIPSDQSTVNMKSFSIEREEKTFSDHRLIWAVLDISESLSIGDGIQEITGKISNLELISQTKYPVKEARYRSSFQHQRIYEMYQRSTAKVDDDNTEPVDMPISDDEEDYEEDDNSLLQARSHRKPRLVKSV